MDHIVKKLSEIEHAAEAVVEHAELEKSELEERIQNERNQFDKTTWRSHPKGAERYPQRIKPSDGWDSCKAEP